MPNSHSSSGSSGYKDETRASFVNFLSEAVNYAAVIATVIVTMSLSIFMDLINSTCNLIRTAFTTYLAKQLQKDLKFRYNYGTDKLETLSMIFCDFLLIIGTLAVLAFAVYRLFLPGEVSRTLLVGVLFKTVCVLADIVLVFLDYRVWRQSRTKVARETFEAMLGSFEFDAAIFLSVLLAFVFKSWHGAVYVEPVASILVAAVIIYKAVGRLRNYIGELTDLTLSEQEQLVLTTALSRHFSSYSRLYSVNSHKIGDTVCVDFKMSFDDRTTYAEIIQTLHVFTEELQRNFEHCRVSLIFDDDNRSETDQA